MIDEIQEIILNSNTYGEAQGNCKEFPIMRRLRERVNSIKYKYRYITFEEAYQHLKRYVDKLNIKTVTLQEDRKAEILLEERKHTEYINKLNPINLFTGAGKQVTRNKALTAKEKKIESWKQQTPVGSMCSPEQLAEFGRVARLAAEGINEEPKQIDFKEPNQVDFNGELKSYEELKGLPKGFKFGNSDNKPED